MNDFFYQLDSSLSELVPAQRVECHGAWSTTLRRTHASASQLGSGAGPFVEVIDARWCGAATAEVEISAIAFLATSRETFWAKAPVVAMALEVQIMLSAFADSTPQRATLSASLGGAVLPGVPVVTGGRPEDACVPGPEVLTTGRVTCLAADEGRRVSRRRAPARSLENRPQSSLARPGRRGPATPLRPTGVAHAAPRGDFDAEPERRTDRRRRASPFRRMSLMNESPSRAGAIGLLFLLLVGCDVLFELDVVVHDHGGEPIPHAAVSVRYERGGAERTACSTDSTGKCEASTVTGGGRFVVVITKDGFRPAVLEVPTEHRIRPRRHSRAVVLPSQPSRAGGREARSVRNFPQ